MSRRRVRQLAALAAVGVVVSAASSCGGSPDALVQDDATPRPRNGPVERVDVCGLAPVEQASYLTGLPLQVVGVAYGSAQVPTARCDLGARFGTPVMSLQLETVAVAPVVFEEAYGEPAGGDPVQVKKLGQGAFLRTESGVQGLHVLVHGSILSLLVRLDPGRPTSRSDLVALAAVAVDAVPRNPALAPLPPVRRCATIDVRDLTAVLGTRPVLSSEFTDTAGSVMCSWAGQPGSVTVTVRKERWAVAAAQRAAGAYHYVDVNGVAPDLAAAVKSRSDTAGDLLVIWGPETTVEISVVPAAGFADPDMPTTPAEVALARNVLARLT